MRANILTNERLMITIDDMRGSVSILQKAIDGVTPSQMSDPSPCEGWTVRDVVNHVTGGADMFAAAGPVTTSGD